MVTIPDASGLETKAVGGGIGSVGAAQPEATLAPSTSPNNTARHFVTFDLESKDSNRHAAGDPALSRAGRANPVGIPLSSRARACARACDPRASVIASAPLSKGPSRPSEPHEHESDPSGRHRRRDG